MKRKILSTALMFLMILFSFPSISFAMTYRDNVVRITSANGIGITGGTYTLNELSITSGQDPNGYNYVGKQYTLFNQELSFTVGRSGSSAVATWFNSRMSGYNNPSVNGDRTTFDEAAGNLNFAFVGDLSLTVTNNDYPNGMTITFPNIGIAQGSTWLSNNWWFGQVTGQHTRDSDGPYTILAFGKDANGNDVYASFLRGSNSVNEIVLERLLVIGSARSTNAKLSNVETVFASLPTDGTQVNLSGFPGSYDPTTNHIQGYVQYKSGTGDEYPILIHSVGTASYAHIVSGPRYSSEKWGFKTYLENWRHPGGSTLIGDYLLVPTEHDNDAHIALYDLRSLPVQELRRVESFDLYMQHKAGAIGIANYTDSYGTEYYLLIVAHLNGENSVYHIYRAPVINGLETANFVEVGLFPLSKDFQGFGLITEQTTNKVYFVGLWSPSEGATFADYAYLYELNTNTWTLGPEIDSHHLVSYGGFAGMLGVHFRYGSTAFVTSDGKLALCATERNSVLGSSLATNDWISQ